MDFALGFSVSNVGPKRFQRILNEFESLEKGWNASRFELEKLEIIGKTYEKFDEFRKSFDHVRYTGQMKKANVEFVSFLDKRYPQNLKRIENPPIGLFCKGNFDLLPGHYKRHSGYPPAGGLTPESDLGRNVVFRSAQDDSFDNSHSGEAKPTPESGFSGNEIPDQVRDDSLAEAGMTLQQVQGKQEKDIAFEVMDPHFREDDNDKNGLLRIAVVGTRKATEYGREVTELLVSELVDNGVCIISGLALGIDGIAHRATVSQKGKAIAVLACGVDCCLPSENYSLYRSILENDGLIISEYPLSQPPNKGTFLARNRIIAALSEGVLVTEAAIGSGSLVTAEYGFAYGKKVFAVPGRINSQMAKGSLSLIKKGAVMVQDAGDILQEFKILNSLRKISGQAKLKNLNEDEMTVVSLLHSEDLTVDELVKKTKFPISKLFGIISGLELLGLVKNSGGKISIIT